MKNSLCIKDLGDFEKFLNDENVENSFNGQIYYISDINSFVIDEEKLIPFRKAPELTKFRFLEGMKLLEVMNNKYIPIIDKDTKELLFTKEEFDRYRVKMSGLEEYKTGNYVFSDNLYFEGLDTYLDMIDDNIKEVDSKRGPVVEEFKKIMESINLSVTIGCNSGGDVELVEAGSTSRYTNVPSKDENVKWDFDFTVRINPDKVWLVKEKLETMFNAKGHITRTSAYKVRLTDVLVPGLSNPIDLDFSLVPQKEKYLSTEESLAKRLDNMKKIDEEKYRLVLANIMYAKDLLKKSGAYKPSRGILTGDRSYGGLGGVGIENWILQHGGSFIDASSDFLIHSEGKEFKEFEKEYAILDFGKDHVSTSKGEFPYHNFVMRNMRYKGYETMKDTLKNFLLELDEKNKTII